MIDAASDRGSGTLLGLALVGTVISTTLVLLPLGAWLTGRAAAEGTADSAALAGADAASGILPGEPCTIARAVATSNHLNLDACSVDGLVVTVTAETVVVGFGVKVSATAGPPGAVSN